MACKGICHRYKAKWITQTFRYANGQKRCNICEIFLEWGGFFCPCCRMLLRTRSRSRSIKGKPILDENLILKSRKSKI